MAGVIDSFICASGEAKDLGALLNQQFLRFNSAVTSAKAAGKVNAEKAQQYNGKALELIKLFYQRLTAVGELSAIGSTDQDACDVARDAWRRLRELGAELAKETGGANPVENVAPRKSTSLFAGVITIAAIALVAWVVFSVVRIARSSS